MESQPHIATNAFLIGDPARAAMLVSLLDGSARPAGELAYAAGVTAQTASSHLGKLLAGGLLLVETEGRHRYYRLAGTHVAHALEHLASIGPLHSVRFTQIGMTHRMIRIQTDSLANHLYGEVMAAHLMGDDSEQVERVGMLRCHREDLPVKRLRLRQPSGLMVL